MDQWFQLSLVGLSFFKLGSLPAAEASSCGSRLSGWDGRVWWEEQWNRWWRPGPLRRRSRESAHPLAARWRCSQWSEAPPRRPRAGAEQAPSRSYRIVQTLNSKDLVKSVPKRCRACNIVNKLIRNCCPHYLGTGCCSSSGSGWRWRPKTVAWKTFLEGWRWGGCSSSCWIGSGEVSKLSELLFGRPGSFIHPEQKTP